MLRAIQEIKPKFVIAENVFGITNIDGGLVFQQVCLDLENEGYEVQPFIICAAAKNAPHRRDRCWFIAYSNYTGRSTRFAQIQNKDGEISKRNNNAKFSNTNASNNWDQFPTQPPICGGDDGLPTELDGITFPKWRAESIKGYGNAIVPQVAFEIFKAIEKTYFDFQK
jgi:DNA (cytosine-5)-methyltransferase 1